jgi:signal peptidase
MLGINPTNLTFGEPDGKTVYMTTASTRAVERFLSDRPGREICWRDVPSCPPPNGPR